MPPRVDILPARVLAPVLFTLLLACSSSESPSASPAPSEAGPADVEDAGPPKIASIEFDWFQEWATPIDDYLSAGRKAGVGPFNMAITDLATFDGRMFIGYGDADVNLGSETPIEIRSFSSPDDPTATAHPIDGAGQGAEQTTPHQSGEEQIDRYRVLDGELWQAGIDSNNPDEAWTQANTEPRGIQGNVYVYAPGGDAIRKYRSVGGGEHVHDVASFGGAVYGVGSGADVRTEFEAGRVFRYLWRSTDRGKTFETVERVEVAVAGEGDTRWVHLLSTRARLFMFGYESKFATNTADLKNATFDGGAIAYLASEHPLYEVFPNGTQALPDGAGILWGFERKPALRSIAVHVDADGTPSELTSFAGSSILDVSLTGTNEILYLTMAGDELGSASIKSYDVKVLVADVATPGDTTELLAFTTPVRPTSIAYHGGALFLGTARGKVLRASVL